MPNIAPGAQLDHYHQLVSPTISGLRDRRYLITDFLSFLHFDSIRVSIAHAATMDLSAIPTLDQFTVDSLANPGLNPNERAVLENLRWEERVGDERFGRYAHGFTGRDISQIDDVKVAHVQYAEEYLELDFHETAVPDTFGPAIRAIIGRISKKICNRSPRRSRDQRGRFGVTAMSAYGEGEKFKNIAAL